jgi:PTS system nitrogen regulatory IIA component
MITLCFLKKPIAFDAPDGQPVRTLFTLICPTVDSHLQLLAKLSFALHDPVFLASVSRQKPKDEILHEARRVEAALESPVVIERRTAG